MNQCAGDVRHRELDAEQVHHEGDAAERAGDGHDHLSDQRLQIMFSLHDFFFYTGFRVLLVTHVPQHAVLGARRPRQRALN